MPGIAFSGVVWVGCVLLAHIGAAAVRSSADQREGRLATPALECPRNDTTSFTGKVTAYRRTSGRVFIRVHTDEDTTEQFTLTYSKPAKLLQLFLIDGRAFKQADWKRIETRAGKLRPNLRATIWACYRGDTPVAEKVEWRPPEQ